MADAAPAPIFWAMHELIRSAPLAVKARRGVAVEREPGRPTYRVVAVSPTADDRTVASGLTEQEAERLAREMAEKQTCTVRV